MKFKPAVLLFFCSLLLSSCATLFKNKAVRQEIGVWGPIVSYTENPSGNFYLAQENQDKIELEQLANPNISSLSLYPLKPLEPGKTYQLMSGDKSEPVEFEIEVREPCLAYLGDPSGKPEVWKKCPGQNAVQITETDGSVQDFSASRFGDRIFYTAANEFNGTDIWQIMPDGNEAKIIYECFDEKCSGLDFSPVIENLVFIQYRTAPQIKILNTANGKISELPNASGSEVHFSPDGQYLSYIKDSTGQLIVINLASMETITQPAGAGLVGEWSRNSESLLFSQPDYWGGIPGIHVFELNVISGAIREVLVNRDQQLEYSQPAYTDDPDVYLASVRERSAGASKYLWLLKEGGKGVKKITNDPLFYYSAQCWNYDFSKLAFQRYPINTSKGMPEVVIWDRKTDTFQVIAENSVRPIWLP